MPKYSRGVIRLLGVVALSVMLSPVVYLADGAPGRDFHRCVQACNDTRKACDDRCVADCSVLYPSGPQRTACVAACKDICSVESAECKKVCLRGGISPTEP